MEEDKNKGCGELCWVLDIDEYWICGQHDWLCIPCTLGIKEKKNNWAEENGK